jgi:vitamin B12 transporter
MRKNKRTPKKVGSGLFSILTILLFTTFQSQAQDSLRTIDLNQVMVSGSRVEEIIKDIPRNVTVIDRQKIERSGYMHLGELLTREAGIFVVGTGQTPGSTQSVFMRGAASNQTAILINGIRVTDPSTPNGVIDLSELSLMDIERIEIVRGSQSSLYGTSGIGGSINLITRKQRTAGTAITGRVQTGTFGDNSSLFQYQAQVENRTDDGWIFGASADHRLVQGLNAALDTLNDPNVFRVNDRDDFEKIDFGAKLGKTFSKGDFTINYRRSWQEADIDAGAFRDDDNYILRFQRDWLQSRLNFDASDNVNLSLIGGYSISNRLSLNDSSVIDNQGNTDQSYFEGNYKGQLLTAELQSIWNTNAFRWVSGTGTYQERMEFDTYFFSDGPWGPFESIVNYDSLDLTARQNYIFSQLNLKGEALGSNLSAFGLSVGGRFTNHNTAGNNFSFELSPNYKFGEGSILFLNYNSGFNAPSLYQLYDPNRGFGAFTTRGNQDLKTENSQSFELGTRISQGNFQWNISVFSSVVTDAIEYVYLWRNSKAVANLTGSDFAGDTYINIARQRNIGAEMGFNTTLFNKLRAEFNLSYIEGEYEYRAEDLPASLAAGHHLQLYNNGIFLDSDKIDDQLVRRPNFLSNMQLYYDFDDKWQAGGFVRYVGSRPDISYSSALGPYGALMAQSVAAFSTVDLQLSYAINSSLKVTARTENLLDNQYSEINGFATRGRSFYLQLLTNFRK